MVKCVLKDQLRWILFHDLGPLLWFIVTKRVVLAAIIALEGLLPSHFFSNLKLLLFNFGR